MDKQVFYSVGQYGQPFDHSVDRPRTIAAFYAAQGQKVLTKVPMRRDVLKYLMSKSAVSYWLEKGWLIKVDKVGRIELLQLTDAGLHLCDASNGPSLMVSKWLKHMTNSQYAIGEEKLFEPHSVK